MWVTLECSDKSLLRIPLRSGSLLISYPYASENQQGSVGSVVAGSLESLELLGLFCEPALLVRPPANLQHEGGVLECIA
jgi:hypothetical protein